MDCYGISAVGNFYCKLRRSLVSGANGKQYAVIIHIFQLSGIRAVFLVCRRQLQGCFCKSVGSAGFKAFALRVDLGPAFLRLLGTKVKTVFNSFLITVSGVYRADFRINAVRSRPVYFISCHFMPVDAVIGRCEGEAYGIGCGFAMFCSQLGCHQTF